MVERSGVTIDGMRVRSDGVPKKITPRRRTVGFDEATKKSRRAAQKRQTTKTRKSEADFGLIKDDTVALKKARLKANEDFLKPVSTLEFDISSKELKPDYSLKHRDAAEVPSKHKKKKNKKSHKGRIIALVIVFVLTAGITGAMLWGNKIITKLTGGNSNIFDFIGAMTSNVKLKADENGRTNILVFGTSGYTMDGDEGNGIHDGAQLTDSIMVVSLDQENGDVAMVSLPRDLYVGNTCTSTGKVNEVYYCANLNGDDEASGAEALKSVMKDIFDLDIHYRVHVDWGALVSIVDGLGGITVTLDEDIEDDWTKTFIKAGEPVTLNGERALGLARARHGTEMGDFTRGNSQQKILAAIQDRIVNGGIDFGTALGLIEAVGDNVRMDFNAEELKSVFYIAKDMEIANMRQIPLIDYKNNIYYLSTAEMNGISYVVPADGFKKYTSIQKYVKGLLSSDPAVREKAVVAIYNGSGRTGAASAEKEVLEKVGIKVSLAADAPDGNYTEKYYVYSINPEKSASAESVAKRYNVEVRPAEEVPNGIDATGVDVVIIVGEDIQV